MFHGLKWSKIGIIQVFFSCIETFYMHNILLSYTSCQKFRHIWLNFSLSYKLFTVQLQGWRLILTRLYFFFFLSLSLLGSSNTGFECIWTSLAIHDDKLYFHFCACADFLLALNKAKTYMKQNVQSKLTLQPLVKLCLLCILITVNEGVVHHKWITCVCYWPSRL